MTIYSRIKELLKLRHLSVRQMEQDLGFYNGTVNRWTDTAPTDKLALVVEYLDTTVDWLVLGRGPVHPQHVGTSGSVKRHVDIADEDVAMSFEGRPISQEDLEIFKRLLRGERE